MSRNLVIVRKIVLDSVIEICMKPWNLHSGR